MLENKLNVKAENFIKDEHKIEALARDIQNFYENTSEEEFFFSIEEALPNFYVYSLSTALDKIPDDDIFTLDSYAIYVNRDFVKNIKKSSEEQNQQADEVYKEVAEELVISFFALKEGDNLDVEERHTEEESDNIIEGLFTEYIATAKLIQLLEDNDIYMLDDSVLKRIKKKSKDKVYAHVYLDIVLEKIDLEQDGDDSFYADAKTRVYFRKRKTHNVTKVPLEYESADNVLSRHFVLEVTNKKGEADYDYFEKIKQLLKEKLIKDMSANFDEILERI